MILINANPVDIGFPAHFFSSHYLLYDTERRSYSLETEVLPCEPADDTDDTEEVDRARWCLLHKVVLEVRNGSYDLGQFLSVLKTFPLYRHLPTEAYERWINCHPERVPLPLTIWEG